MEDTRERILLTALRLFAADGYEAVSVSDIAGALGITKGALYRHYRSKRDIFDSILARMEARDTEQANAHALPEGAREQTPEGAREQTPEAYRAATADQIADFSKAMFRYWTQDDFAAQFRRMLTLEQYRDAEMERLYRQYLADGPLGYVADLFGSLGIAEPRKRAAAFYGPMFLLYSVYDGAEDKQAVLDALDSLMDDAREQLKKEGQQS